MALWREVDEGLVLLARLCLGTGAEGGAPSEEYVEHAPERPHLHLAGVRAALVTQHLGRGVVDGAEEELDKGLEDADAAKVTQLDVA